MARIDAILFSSYLIELENPRLTCLRTLALLASKPSARLHLSPTILETLHLWPATRSIEQKCHTDQTRQNESGTFQEIKSFMSLTTEKCLNYM
jgi:hypothetical protein